MNNDKVTQLKKRREKTAERSQQILKTFSQVAAGMEENANEALAVQNEIKATIAELEEEAKKVADDYEKYNRIMGNIVALLEG